MSRRKKTASIENSTTAQAAALDRFQPLLDPEEFRALLEELKRPLLPAFRLNPFKADPKQAEIWQQWYGWQLHPVPFCPLGWQVSAAETPISHTLEHRLGHYYIQDASSMLPVELFDFPAGEHPLILDMAASPGGKTTHLAARSADHGLIIANDAGADRLTALRLVLQTWGTLNAAVTRFPGEKFGRWFPETFDRILLDAPCSMQSLRSTESHPMRSISEREQSALARRQSALLASAFSALKVGGQLVYSTCTLAPQENEAVLDRLLSSYPQCVEIMPLDKRLPIPTPALTSDLETDYHPEVSQAARLWPHRYSTTGFFAALIGKKDSVSFDREEAPQRPLALVGQTRLPKAEAVQLTEEFLGAYGFDLNSVLDEYHLELWRSKENIFAVPSAYIQQFADLPCHLLGLKVAQATTLGWIPAHDWISRFERQFFLIQIMLEADLAEKWLHGEDILTPGDPVIPINQVVILRDFRGRFLGRGRIQGQRIKNLLPHRLVWN
jgi:16S rRNA (cytosine1407-C5)-methyltransferase